jgi:electron transfer flavoprotein alpha subunit
METILLLAHTEPDGTLAKPALECLTAALALGGSLTVGLVGARVEAAASQIAGCGAARFLAVTGERSRNRATRPTPPPPKRFAARPAPPL